MHNILFWYVSGECDVFPGKMWQISKKKKYTQNVHVMFWKVSITNCITQKAHIFLSILWFIGLDLYDSGFS